MSRIKVAVVGDHWCNRQEVIDNMALHQNSSHLVLEINTEGPSLHALGVVEAVCNQARNLDFSCDKIWVDCWHNTVETVPFKRAYKPLLSHFFWMSDNYRHTVPRPAQSDHVAALFVGRATLERAVIMYELYHMPKNTVLLSLMQNHGALKNFSQDDIRDWLPFQEHKNFLQWWQDPPVTSITDHAVSDQYKKDKNTNADLVLHYNRFSMEIVCETYCHGETFFPTEKTVRPISQGKPMLLFGPKYFLSRLRDLGFWTWQEIWDESYDLLEGLDRWQAMKNIFRQILDKKHWQDHRLPAIADHNRLTLEKLIARYRPG